MPVWRRSYNKEVPVDQGNILASGTHLTTAVLEVVDCSEHMVKGGKKDAEYIAELFLPWMKKLDPNKQRVDLLFFDGASNVQKAGKILEVAYPRVTCLHAAEHVVSLFFKDLCRTLEVILLIKVYHKSMTGLAVGHFMHHMLSSNRRLRMSMVVNRLVYDVQQILGWLDI